MMNFAWVIPWAVIIIFAAGWILGSKFQHKKEKNQRCEEQLRYRDEEIRRHVFDRIESRVYDLEKKTGIIKEGYKEEEQEL